MGMERRQLWIYHFSGFMCVTVPTAPSVTVKLFSVAETTSDDVLNNRLIAGMMLNNRRSSLLSLSP
jgi:hypothetical protein